MTGESIATVFRISLLKSPGRMRIMFVSKSDGELTQVDFWNLYKDIFSPFADKYPLLVASDVIKNVTNIFPQAQAMVLQGPVQRFVVRGVDRRKEPCVTERFRCQWDRSQCSAPAFMAPGELFDHVLQHLASIDAAEVPCLWSSCPQQPLPKHTLSSHILTHLSSTQPLQKHPSQSDTITLPSEGSPYPISNPTSRPPPPPRSTVITYERPIVDPPSTSLTALLILRILFRTSFASADAAPRVDADHFGFPGVIEDTDDPEGADPVDGEVNGDEKEGERRGRKAFVGVRKQLEGVRIRDEALMGWITEMVDAGISGTTNS
jgi:chromatin structure-remodeling complex subunit RSC9